MARHTTIRDRLLLVYQILQEHTDEAHPLPLSALIAELNCHGITAERKSLYEDFEALRHMGVDVQYKNGEKGGWFVGARTFQLAELKLLVDTVQACRFLSKQKSEALIEKLTALASSHEAGELRREVYVEGRVKTMNESTYANIDQIQAALHANRVISFHYFEYNAQKEQVLRRNGTRYFVSPKGLIWNNENYYLAALDHLHQEMRHFRVDKMQDIEGLNLCQLGEAAGADFDIAAYSKKHFGMFRGREVTVEMRCQKELVGVMLDRFGMESRIVPEGEAYLYLTVEVAVSPQFLAWLFGLGDKVELLSPYWAVQEYKQRLRAVLHKHEGFKE